MTTQTVDFIRITLEKNRRIKLKFRHAQLRKAVATSGRSIAELFTDPFGGWPHLLAEGHRPYDPQVTIDKASDWIDDWVRLPNPETGQERTLDELGLLLMDALKASKFIVIKPEESNEDEKKDGESEGNAA